MTMEHIEKRPILVAVLGFSEHERAMLRSIFKLSLYRGYTYTLVLADEACQILLIDADDPNAMADWRTLYGGKNNGPRGPASRSVPAQTIMVSSDTATGSTDCTWLRRPFITTRVLNVFDQVAARLPVESRPGAATAMDSTQANQASDADTPARKVLVVDDSSTVRIQLQLELKPFGVRVDTAESGEQALQLLEEGSSYDLIFLDVILPGIDGYQICKRVKKNKAIRKTPVVMLTSKSSPFDRVKGALAGCDTYLTKPVAQSAFQNVVKKYLKQP